MIRDSQKIRLSSDLWDFIRLRAEKNVRNISQQIEYDLKNYYLKLDENETDGK